MGGEWVEVVSVKELQRARKKLVVVGDEQIALFWHDEQPFAFRNICVHKGKELVKGVILNGRVICPGHQWAFELGTGWAEKTKRCQPTYPVKVEDGVVYVVPEQQILVQRERAVATEAG